MNTDPLVLLSLLAAGFVAGVLNVIAGGGSLLTLPVLIFAGLPAVTANGTNRVAILMQNVVATWRFHGRGVVPWRMVGWAAIPATIGSVLGARLALSLSDQQFQRVLAWIMVAVTLWTLWRSRRSGRDTAEAKVETVETVGTVGTVETVGTVGTGETVETEARSRDVADDRRPRPWLLAAGFLAVGVYGGFVQAGVGFLILAALSMAGLDLVRGNAVKVVAVLCFTVVALAVFARNGEVDWLLGVALGVGNSLGAVLGVRWTVLKGHAWVERFVAVTVIVFAVALWIRS